ncbi:deaminase [Actinophytocola xinjiangensis]|uniref:Deaminase n=1 Tax=Actinophytocola xinjiangensis TaxID=485602 RepID=A0A7Z0WMX5_9PSEU|nr:dihydrofolate reductase family protein [Actinophytocola xinjiangensis]OLF10869.1 deaminase [Actinophytocola xinjiangensis]
MSTIVVETFLTLDGVLQAPGARDEDTEGGFTHGGWQAPLFDEAMGEFVGEAMAHTEGLLLGRKTYDIFAGFWPKLTEDHPDYAFGQIFTDMPKYVATRTLTSADVDWENTILLSEDIPAEVAELRAQPGGEIKVVGSGELVQTLLEHNLVDRYRLMTFPVMLGTGKKLFAGGTVPRALELVESRTTPAGAVITVYRPTGEPTYASFEPAH